MAQVITITYQIRYAVRDIWTVRFSAAESGRIRATCWTGTAPTMPADAIQIESVPGKDFADALNLIAAIRETRRTGRTHA